MIHTRDDDMSRLPFNPLKNCSFTKKLVVSKKPYDVRRKIKETHPYKYTNQETLMTPYISDNLAKSELFQYNFRELIDEIYQKEGDPYCLVKYKYDTDNKLDNNLLVDIKIEDQFNEFLSETKKILELVYGIYEKEKETIELSFFWIKDQEPARGINTEIIHSDHAESRSEEKMDMIKYVRNFQVIMMCEIYSFIKERYNTIKNLEDLKNLTDPTVLEKVKEKLNKHRLITPAQYKIKGETFLNVLKELNPKVLEVLKEKYISDISKELLHIVDERIYDFYIFISEKYNIHNEPKIRYIFIMFEGYLRTIYLPYIDKAFKNLSYYETFNLFNIHYLINLLLLKNNIFFRNKLDINDFDLYAKAPEIIEAHKTKIDKINSILDNIDNFLKYLDENNHQHIIEFGCKLLNTTPDIFDKELKQSLFFSNLLIDEALLYIRPSEGYESEIINSPASKEISEINFCEIIDEIPYTDNKKTKIYGTANDVLKYKMTCREKYETMDYLSIKSPLAKFMLFYWSSLMNSYLTARAIKDNYNNVLIWGENNILYDKDTRLFSKYRNKTTIKKIMTEKLYLGYIKLTVTKGIKVIFIFLNSYFIELFDIYGMQIQYGNYNPFSFSTSQEIATHLNNKSIFNLVHKVNKDKDNKYYYLLLRQKYVINKDKQEYVPHHSDAFWPLLENTKQEPYWKNDPQEAEWKKQKLQKQVLDPSSNRDWRQRQPQQELSERYWRQPRQELSERYWRQPQQELSEQVWIQ